MSKVQTIGIFQELDDRNGDNASFIAFESDVLSSYDNLLKESLMAFRERVSCRTFSLSGILHADWM